MVKVKVEATLVAMREVGMVEEKTTAVVASENGVHLLRSPLAVLPLALLLPEGLLATCSRRR